MKLRSQVLLAALGTALICGSLGARLLARRVSEGAARVLDGTLEVGVMALQRQWVLRRAEREAVYRGVTAHAYFRAYLLASDRAQMEYFCAQLRQRGADAVAILDGRGEVLAEAGSGVKDLLRLPAAPAPPSGSDPIQLAAIAGSVADVYRIDVGSDRMIGRVLIANVIDRPRLLADARPFGVEAAVVAGHLVSATFTLAPGQHLLQAARQGSRFVNVESASGASAGHRARLLPLQGGLLLAALPLGRIGALIEETSQLANGLILLVLGLVMMGLLIVLGRVTWPLERLTSVAHLLGKGDLGEARVALPPRLLERSDELGVLARSFSGAATQLHGMISITASAVTELDRAVRSVETSSGAVAAGATQQELRLRELTGALTDLTTTIGHLSGMTRELHGCLSQLRTQAQKLDLRSGQAAATVARAQAMLRTALARAATGKTVPAGLYERVLSDVSRQLESLSSPGTPTTGRATGPSLSFVLETSQQLVDRLARAHQEERHLGDRLLQAATEIDQITRGQGHRVQELAGSALVLRRVMQLLRSALAPLTAARRDSRRD